MKLYDVTVTKFGFATIKAKSEEEAFEIAKEMATDDFDWSDDIDITNCQESDNR